MINNVHAQAVKKGDKYSYDYYGNIINARAWAQYSKNFGNFGVNLGGELGHTTLWRHGIWKKGLFLDNSQGDSKKQNYLTYKLKANFSYKFSAAHSIVPTSSICKMLLLSRLRLFHLVPVTLRLRAFPVRMYLV